MTAPDPIDWADLRDDQAPDDPWAEDEPHVQRPDAITDVTATFGKPSPECIAERERVLRHPDIAKRLCDPPLRYSRPEVWNGYLPPETWQGRHNDSPQRAALLAIISAAVEADKAQEADRVVQG